METEESRRFRSFAERYVVERARLFRPEFEADDAWACVLAAKTAYKMINRQAGEFRAETNEAGEVAQQWPVAAQGRAAVVGPVGPTHAPVQSARPTPQQYKPATVAPSPKQGWMENLARLRQKGGGY